MHPNRYFTITDVAHLSALKAHTLRIWEKRYSRFNPKRSLGNVRHFSIEDLDIVLKLAVLNKAGYKISKLIAMDGGILDCKLNDLRGEEDKRNRQIMKLIIHMFTIDIDEFEAVLNQCISEWGLDKTINLIIVPLMERVNLYSCKNCPLEVDFAVTTIRKKIYLGIEKASPLQTMKGTALLFLPQGEHYDLLLLYYLYLLKSKGLKALYMGANVSYDKVRHVLEIKRPDFIITYVSAEQQRRVDELRNFAANHLTQGLLLASGPEPYYPVNEPVANFKFINYKDVIELLLVKLDRSAEVEILQERI